MRFGRVRRDVPRYGALFVVLAWSVSCGRRAEVTTQVPVTSAVLSPDATPAPTAAVPPAVPLAAIATPQALTVPAPATTAQVPAKLCEVELTGNLTGTALPAGSEAIVYVALGDCLAPGAHVLARAIGSAQATFFAEVFVPCGTDLTVCGSFEPASLDAAPKPTSRYGKVDRLLHAVGEGEIEFRDLAIPIATGPTRSFPAPRP